MKKYDFNKVIKNIEDAKNYFFNHRFNKYIVSYKINGDMIRVYSNIGNYHDVLNTKENISKLEKAIVRNKLEIINEIENYEKESKQRLGVLIFNIILVSLTGALIPLSFFSGVYLLLMFSFLTFSFTVITTSMIGVEYYVLAKEIQNLKELTGYKKENEFKLPNINNIFKSKKESL